jgi:acyl carrier protein
MGARLVVHPADVSEEPELSRVLSNIRATLPPLRGLVHAAGVLDDGTIRQLSWERFARVLRPKVAGAWNLHKLTLGTDLDFFILYSSFASVLGSPGQANHAAANAFLDALAAARRAQGLTALSIDWGAWSTLGAAAERGVDRRLMTMGGGTISPDQGLRLLEMMFPEETPRIAAVAVDWTRVPASLVRKPILADLVPRGATTPARDSWFLERCRTGSPASLRRVLEDLVRDGVAAVLGLESAQSIGPHQGFFELGMDSLTSVELRNRLSATVGLTIPSTVTFDHPTTSQLADFLLDALCKKGDRDRGPGRSCREGPGQAPEPRGLGDLSISDLESLLDEELRHTAVDGQRRGPGTTWTRIDDDEPQPR